MMKTIAPALEQQEKMAGKTVLGVGLIGCGERGAMLAGHVQRTRNIRLVMTMDANTALAEDLGKRYGVPWSVNLDDVLAHESVDAVIISTPHFLHAPQAIRAAKARKHLMIEKPLATSLADGVAVVQAARDAGVRVSCILPFRYQPHVLEAKRLIAQGAIGELFGASLVYQQDKFSDYWQRGLKGRTFSDWRMHWKTSGGGVLIASVIHYLDWMRHLPGVEIVEVSARHATLDSPGEVEDTMSLVVVYSNGAIGTVNASSCVRGVDFTELRLWGRDGHMSLGRPAQFCSLRLIDGYRPGQWHEFSGPRGIAARDVEYMTRFASLVLAGEAPEIPGEEALAVQAVIDAAYESARTGRAEPVQRGPW